MKKHIHGGNIYQMNDCLDFSANCNPLGIPESVKKAIVDSFEHLEHYPQVGYKPLKEAIAYYESCDEKHVICGNGAAELIYTLCIACKPRKALMPAPTFAEYEMALHSVECDISYYMLSEEKGYLVGEDFCEHIGEDTDIVFLCNPNNPTGMLTDRTVLLKIAEKCRAMNTLLVVDECFLDFVRYPERYSLLDELEEFSNLFLLKAFTKRYAMAGIRLGYGLSSNHELLDKMMQSVQPWNISVMAQEAGIAALQETEYVEKGRQIVFAEQVYLMEGLQKCGFKVFPSQANYIFFHGPVGLKEKCEKENILIRDCSNYENLSNGWYRIAVRLHSENEQLIETLWKIMKDGE